MIRRRLLLAGTAALGGCSVLPQPAYVQRSTWSLAVAPLTQRPRRAHAKVLVVRDFQAAPGVEIGVQWLNRDGSVHVDFYNQWEVPPARSVAADARGWLAASGLFAAVVGPASGLAADLALEGELTVFIADPRVRRGRAALSITLLNQRTTPARVLTQRILSAVAPMPTDTPAGVVAAQRGALAAVLTQLTAVLEEYA